MGRVLSSTQQSSYYKDPATVRHQTRHNHQLTIMILNDNLWLTNHSGGVLYYTLVEIVIASAVASDLL